MTENGQIRIYKEENFGIKLTFTEESGLVFADWHMTLNIIMYFLHVTEIMRKSYDNSISTFA